MDLKEDFCFMQVQNVSKSLLVCKAKGSKYKDSCWDYQMDQGEQVYALSETLKEDDIEQRGSR